MTNDASGETRRMEEMTWPELKKRIDSSVVFLPVGSTEQHGHHLPLDVDVAIAEEFAERVASAIDGIVAPSVVYGYKSQAKSGGGKNFLGTVNLDGETLQSVVRNVIRDLTEDDAQRIVVVNGHYENEYFIREAIDLHLESGGEGEFMIVSWWEILSDETLHEVFEDVPGGFPGWSAEHAGITETSLMQYFRPEVVREESITDDQADRTPDYVLKPAPGDIIPDSGTFYKSTHASSKVGERIARDVIDATIDAIETEWGR